MVTMTKELDVDIRKTYCKISTCTHESATNRCTCTVKDNHEILHSNEATSDMSIDNHNEGL